MNHEQQKEYEEIVGSPEMERMNYLMEHPEEQVYLHNLSNVKPFPKVPKPVLVTEDKYMNTNIDTSFRYVCRECKCGFEGNCNGCYLLNEQVKNQ